MCLIVHVLSFFTLLTFCCIVIVVLGPFPCTMFPVSSVANFPDWTVSELTAFPVSSAENFPDWTVSELTAFPVSSAENFPDWTISELTAFPVSSTENCRSVLEKYCGSVSLSQ